ncbi:ParB family protein [Salmonella enterica]
MAGQPRNNVADVLAFAEQKLFAIAQSHQDGGLTDISACFDSVLAGIAQRYEAERGSLSGTPSGLEQLDALTCGFQPADLIIAAARPSVGKTAFALTLCVNALMLLPAQPVQIYSMEMSAEQLLLRLVSLLGRVSQARLRSGDLSDDDWQQIGISANVLTTEWKDRLLQGNFERERSPDDRFAEPLMETAMVVTLEQLRPYDLNPRLMRNPYYDDIKASIRQRGLDTPPPITRRPDQDYYIIANGGNTRLSILNELWRETHDKRFWRIHCLFKPWGGTSEQPVLGELRCLIGHLAENDLHGKLSFIERALGINKARELYQQVLCQLSQRELAEHLRNDGYPIHQSHISRMEQTLEYLLPLLYAGMGRPQVEKLLSLRAAALQIWQRHATGDTGSFESLFSSALSLFNDQPEDFFIERVQDELLGLMSQELNVDYNLLLLDVDPSEQKRQAVLGPTPEPPPYIPPEEPEPRPVTRRRKPETEEEDVGTPAPLPEPEEATSLLCEGTEPVTDIWRIPQLWDTTESLRSASDRLAWDLAEHYAIDDRVISDANKNGIGFRMMPFASDHPMFTRPQSRACWALLAALNGIPLSEDLASALTPRLFLQRDADGFFFSDEFLIKAFRLIRIVRRIKELQQEAQHAADD